jgi:hypothetical protein
MLHSGHADKAQSRINRERHGRLDDLKQLADGPDPAEVAG